MIGEIKLLNLHKTFTPKEVVKYFYLVIFTNENVFRDLGETTSLFKYLDLNWKLPINLRNL